MKEGIKNLMD